MKTLTHTLSALAMAIAAGTALAQTPAPVLNRAAFDALLAHPEKVLVIDVRRPDEVATKGGFPAYLSIQLRELDRYAGIIPRDRQLITVSNHAGRAVKAAAQLAAKGYTVAGAIGVEGYEAEGGTLVRSAPVAAH